MSLGNTTLILAAGGALALGYYRAPELTGDDQAHDARPRCVRTAVWPRRPGPTSTATYVLINVVGAASEPGSHPILHRRPPS